jgi:hypothetical protein
VSKVTDVVQAAVKALPEWLGGQAPSSVRVEEVEPPEHGSEWRVTLSYLESLGPRTRFDAILGGVAGGNRPLERVLRVIVVDGDTLEAKKMKIRE